MFELFGKFQKLTKKLFEKYPESDIVMSALKNRPGLIEEYEKALSKISTAVTIGSDLSFEEAKNEYISLFERFRREGFTYSGRKKAEYENKVQSLRAAINYATYKISSFEKQVKKIESEIEPIEKKIQQHKISLEDAKKELDELKTSNPEVMEHV